MFATAMSYIENAFVTGAIGLVCGILFGQKIKDWLSGVPADFRTAMQNVEVKAKADVSAAVADVFARINPVAVKPPVAPAPAPAPVVATPVAPVAPALAVPAA